MSKMKKTEIVNKISRGFNRAKLCVKTHSPEILVGAGIVGGVGACVLACKATLKVNEVIEEAKENIEKIHVATETGVTEAGLEYTEEDSKKDLTIVYVQTGVKFVKLYGPAIILGTVAIASVIAGHNKRYERYAAMSTAYALVDKGYKEYRNRVVDRFGKELDQELLTGAKAIQVEKIYVDDKGEEKTVTETVDVVEADLLTSPYMFFFEDGCKGWEKNAEWNKNFLIQAQNFFNDRLQTIGYVYLNEVLKYLGIPMTEMGQTVGWMLGNGDNVIDFGMAEVNRKSVRDFVNGYIPTILLHFNCDGEIAHLM
jgi:hypothetical protein